MYSFVQFNGLFRTNHSKNEFSNFTRTCQIKHSIHLFKNPVNCLVSKKVIEHRRNTSVEHFESRKHHKSSKTPSIHQNFTDTIIYLGIHQQHTRSPQNFINTKHQSPQKSINTMHHHPIHQYQTSVTIGIHQYHLNSSI